MKTDKNGCSTCQKGEEHYETFKVKQSKKQIKAQTFFQYDYRDTDGELFSCVRSSLDQCRISRDNWLLNKHFNN
jgi:hypothetical protein